MKLSKALLSGVIALVALTGCGADKSAIINVNERPITMAQYQEAYNKEVSSPYYQQFGDYLKDKNSVMNLLLRDRIANELILKETIKQEIEKRNITVTSDEIKQKRQEIQDKLGSKEKLDEVMSKNGITNKEFEQDIENEIKMDKLASVAGNTVVSDKEVKAFYDSNKKMFDYPQRVRASHILISVNPAQIKQEIISQDKKGVLTADEINKKTQEIIDTKMNLAKEIRAKASQNPESFAELAKQYSDDKVSAERGGDLGFFTKDTMVKPFSDAAFNLKPGTISEVVVSDFGNHIILVTDKAQAGIQPFATMKDEIKTYLEQKKKIDSMQKLLEGLKASSKIEYVNPDFDPKNIQETMKQKLKEEEEAAKKSPASESNKAK